MQGRRITGPSEYSDLRPGDYGLATDINPAMPEGYWFAAMPVERNDGFPVHLGTLNPSKHTITEHEDGTITVSPSILTGDGRGNEVYHGYLERGVWRSC